MDCVARYHPICMDGIATLNVVNVGGMKMSFRYSIYDHRSGCRHQIKPEYLQRVIAFYMHAILEEEE